MLAMRLLAILACLSLFAADMIAADVSGNWRGSIEVKMPDGEIVNHSLHMEAVQKGGEVTGTIGREADEKLTIDKGKMEGNTLSFEVTPPEGSFPVKFELMLEGSKLEGTFKGDTGDGPVSGKMTLNRAE